MTHPNVDRLHRGYAAFATGDMVTLAELIAEDAVWHIGGRNDLTGDYEGRDAIFGLFGRLAQESEGTLSVEVHDALANDSHGAVLAKVSAGGARGSVAIHTTDTFHLEDGKVKEFWSFPDDQYAWDAYWTA